MSRLKPYTVPQYDVPVKLNQNESPFDLPAEVKSKITAQFLNSEWNRYPLLDQSELKTALAEYAGVRPDQVLIGNGSNELISTVVNYASLNFDRIVTMDPAFPVYERAARVALIPVMKVPLGKNFEFDIPSIIDEAGPRTMLMLDTPNNPTGSTLTLDEIETLLSGNPGLMLLDEAYFEFSGVSAAELIDKYKQLVVTRTFSKAFGLAGIRFGYLLADSNVVRELYSVKLPFSVSSLTLLAARAALEETALILPVVSKIQEQREYLFKELSLIPGVKPFPSSSNFILCRFSMDAETIYAQLLKEGILLRAFDHPGLIDTLRITVGSQEENRFLLSALRRIMERLS